MNSQAETARRTSKSHKGSCRWLAMRLCLYWAAAARIASKARTIIVDEDSSINVKQAAIITFQAEAPQTGSGQLNVPSELHPATISLVLHRADEKSHLREILKW